MSSVIIYTRDLCGYCMRAKQLLDSKNVDYTEINISEEPDRKQEMVKRSGGQSTFPQIFFDDEHVGGCDDLHELERRGHLDQLLDHINDTSGDS